jgi:hypothetical protein
MKTLGVSAAVALVIGVVLAAEGVPALHSGPQGGPDLSGRWNRDGPIASASEGWGPRVEITQTGANVTIQPAAGKPSLLRVDGTERADVIAVDGCKNTVRITKAVSSRDKVTITTWLVVKSVCVHGEDEDDPLVTHVGVVDMDKVFGRRRLESITDVYRDGNTLTVETTRSSPGGETTTTTSTYRR